MPKLTSSSLIATALPLRRSALEGHDDEESSIFRWCRDVPHAEHPFNEMRPLGLGALRKGGIGAKELDPLLKVRQCQAEHYTSHHHRQGNDDGIEGDGGEEGDQETLGDKQYPPYAVSM